MASLILQLTLIFKRLTQLKPAPGSTSKSLWLTYKLEIFEMHSQSVARRADASESVGTIHAEGWQAQTTP